MCHVCLKKTRGWLSCPDRVLVRVRRVEASTDAGKGRRCGPQASLKPKRLLFMLCSTRSGSGACPTGRPTFLGVGFLGVAIRSSKKLPTFTPRFQREASGPGLYNFACCIPERIGRQGMQTRSSGFFLFLLLVAVLLLLGLGLGLRLALALALGFGRGPVRVGRGVSVGIGVSMGARAQARGRGRRAVGVGYGGMVWEWAHERGHGRGRGRSVGMGVSLCLCWCLFLFFVLFCLLFLLFLFSCCCCLEYLERRHLYCSVDRCSCSSHKPHDRLQTWI